jgi:hypothetical protein
LLPKGIRKSRTTYTSEVVHWLTLIVWTVIGCGANSGRISPIGSAANDEGVEGITLERRHPRPASYERTLAAWLSNNGAGRPFRFEARVSSDVAPLPDGSFSEELRFAPLEVSGADGPIDPLPSDLVGLERVRMTMRTGATNAIIEGPAHSGDGPSASFLGELAEVFRHLRLVYPDRPLRIGERWEGPPIVWDTRPLGWITLELTPTWILESVEDGVARVLWESDLTIQPFRAMGLNLEGAGEVRGVTLVALDDGTSGSTDLDIDVGLRPAGGGITALRVRAKFLEEVRAVP